MKTLLQNGILFFSMTAGTYTLLYFPLADGASLSWIVYLWMIYTVFYILACICLLALMIALVSGLFKRDKPFWNWKSLVSILILILVMIPGTQYWFG